MKKERSDADITIDPELRKQIDETLHEAHQKTDYANNIIRLAASVFFCFMIAYDKLFHLFVPPLPEYWYGISIGIMLFGKDIVTIWFRLKGVRTEEEKKKDK